MRSQEKAREGLGFVGGAVVRSSYCRVALLGVVVMVIAGCGRSNSWEWGYNKAEEADTQVSGGMSPEFACRGIAKIAIRFADSRALADPSGAPTDLDDAVEGCLAGWKDLGR